MQLTYVVISVPCQIAIYLDSVTEFNRQNTIAELSRAGHSPAKIISLTGYAKTTIYRAKAKWNETGDVKRAKHKAKHKKHPYRLNYRHS